MLQLPAATLALQLCVPSVTVTVPVGVPLPGAVAVTVNVKLAAWPSAVGFGGCPVMAVVGGGAFTAWGVPLDALGAWLVVPLVVCVRVVRKRSGLGKKVEHG